MNKTYYYLDFDMPESAGEPILNVTPASYWETNHAQADFTETGVLDELKKGGFEAYEMMEAMLEFFAPHSALSIHMFLTQHPDFEENPEFTAFIKSHSNNEGFFDAD